MLRRFFGMQGISDWSIERVIEQVCFFSEASPLRYHQVFEFAKSLHRTLQGLRYVLRVDPV